jgi:hypothetical protein
MADGVVTLELLVRGDLELLRRIAALDGRLKAGAEASAEDGSVAVDFVVQP